MFFVSLLLNQIVGWMRDADRHLQPARDRLHGRDRRLLPAGRESAVEGAAADAAQAGARVRRRRRARHPEPGRSRLQGARRTPAPGSSAGCRPSATRRACSTASRARPPATLDRAEADRILSALDKRVFLLHNVHAAEAGRVPDALDDVVPARAAVEAADPQADWTQAQAGRRSTPAPAGSRRRASADPGAPGARRRAAGSRQRARSCPPGIEQFFVPARRGRGESHVTMRRWSSAPPGSASPTRNSASTDARDVLYAAPIADGAVPVDWQQAGSVLGPPAATCSGSRSPERRRSPSCRRRRSSRATTPAGRSRSASGWPRSQRLELLRHRETKLTSTAGENERDFRARVQDALREARDAEVDAIREKYRGQARSRSPSSSARPRGGGRPRAAAGVRSRRRRPMLSIGAAALGALLGRKAISTGTLGRATTAARGMGRSMKEAEDVKRAGEGRRGTRRSSWQPSTQDRPRARPSSIAARYDAPVELERAGADAKARPGRGAVRRARVGPRGESRRADPR